MIEAEQAVTCTIGPKGRTVFLNNGTIHPVATKDGITVLKFIDFSDPYKDLGVNIIREATRKVNGECGDGSTTTTLITTELCKAGNQLINQDFDAVDIQKGFQKAAEDVIEVLEKNKKVVDSEDDILHIATISANNDEEIGNIIKEAFVNVGENGVVNAEVAKNRKGKTTITYSSGFETNRGYISSASANQSDDSCVFNNPLFFVYGKKLENIQDILPVFQIANDNPVVIVAPVYTEDFRTAFIENVEMGRIKSVAILPPGTNKETIDDGLMDIAKVTGATVVEGKFGQKIDNFNAGFFGSSESIKVKLNKTSIIGGKGKQEDIDKYVDEIKEKIEKGLNGSEEEVMSEYEVRYLEERIAALTGGVATIWIGGFSDLELQEKKYRYEDAINAVNAAITDGILAGGGAGLLHAVKEIEETHERLPNADQEKGYTTFLRVMEEPARRIISSTGKDAGYWAEKIKESKNNTVGFNAKTEEFCDDMYNIGVIDPVKVEIMAIHFGTSIAGTFVTANCVITSDAYNCKVVANDRVFDEEKDMFGNE